MLKKRKLRIVFDSVVKDLFILNVNSVQDDIDVCFIPKNVINKEFVFKL